MAQKTTIEIKSVLNSQKISFHLPIGAKPVSIKDDLNKYADYKHNDFTLLPDSKTKDGSIIWEIDTLTKVETDTVNEKSSSISVQYVAFYLSVNRFSEFNLRIKSAAALGLFVDNCTDCREIEKNRNERVYKIALETGVHLIRLKSVLPNSIKSSGIREIFVETNQDSSNFEIATAPKVYPNFEQLLNDTKVSSVSMSSTGNYAIVTTSNYDVNEKQTMGRMLLIDVKKQTVLQTFNSKNYSDVKWIPNSDRFSYQNSNNQSTKIFIYDISTGTQTQLLEEIRDLYYTMWDKTGKILYYVTAKDKQKFIEGIKRHQNINDKISGAKESFSIVSYNVDAKTSTELITSKNSITLLAVDQENKTLIYSADSVDYDTRPYLFQTVKQLNLISFEEKNIGVFSRFSSVSFIDSDNLLILANASVFNKSKNKKVDEITNDYNTLAFRYSISKNIAVNLLPDFKPEISWGGLTNDSKIAFYLVTEGQCKNIYRHEITSGKIEKVPTPCEVVQSYAISQDGKYGIVLGSSVTTPAKVFLLELSSMKFNEIKVLNETQENITVPKTKDIKFKNKENQEIEGLVYYPLNFDASKQYPCIVYYYGGTTPVTREFEGRYPKNIWAANGYFVLVLIPRGTIGYGQQFADNHVNDWGEKTSDDIIESVKQFIHETPQVDKNAIGCIGASYGGFMTLTLTEKTDIFTAAIAHAAISNLASYWGVGFWGVDYSTVASAESFPWNRRDIYIEKSPLYNADKVKTPLMLLHGNSDTNVPIGESYQFYAALKLLGKDVELIEVEGENHHILDHDKRERWSKLILAYFDKYLKKQPEWWNYIFENKR